MRRDAEDFGVKPAAGITGPLFEGPFARSRFDPTALEAAIAEMVWPRRRECPVSIAGITAATGAEARAVKEAVENLVACHRCMIGARRGEPAGYFWIVSAEDQVAAVGPYKAQILAMLRRLRVLDSPEDYCAFIGQLPLEGD